MQLLQVTTISDTINLILELSFKQISQKLFDQGLNKISEWQSFTTTNSMTTLQFIQPDKNIKIDEDFELQPTSQENFQSYKICLNEKNSKEIEHKSKGNVHHSKHESHLLQYTWDKSYHYNLIEMPQQEIIIPIEDEKMRLIKIQQTAELNKQKDEQQKQFLLKKKQNETYQRLQSQLNRKSYTYDYNCALIMNKQFSFNQNLIPQLSFQIKNDKQNNKIKQSEYQENITKPSKNKTQNSTFFQDTSSEEFERQTSNVPFIQLSKGVKLTENNSEIRVDIEKTERLSAMRRTDYQNLQHQDLINIHLEQIKSSRIRKDKIQTQRATEELLINPEQINAPKQIQKIITLPQKRPNIKIDPNILKQDIIKLPKVRSRSINSRSKTTRLMTFYDKFPSYL